VEAIDQVTPPNQGVVQPWRDVLPIHPAADLLPRMLQAELQELGEDIKKRGLVVPVTILKADPGRAQLLDGIGRLDAMEMAGIAITKNGELDRGVVDCRDVYGVDPYAYILSANLHRRHLTAEQKRDLIAKLLKARPEASNLTIAKQVKADDKTVAKLRRRLEATSEIPKLEKTVGADGKSRGRQAAAFMRGEIQADGRRRH
jgi:hypothetical protein